MKVFSSDQLHAADQFTIKKEGISSTDLMERAASMVFDEIDARLQGNATAIKIFCGIGNNGGDGLVIARLLLNAGYQVLVYIVNYSSKRSKDFLINYERIKDLTNQWPVLLTQQSDLPEVDQTDFVIDAVFGIGLNRPMAKWVGKLIDHLNNSNAYLLSVDMPSGMFVDKPTPSETPVVRADFTMTFQSPKMPFFLPETGAKVGALLVLDIGLDQTFLDQLPALADIVERSDAQTLYRPRQRFSHKGTYGHALLIGGSYGKMGSICLSSSACLRSGAGMASVFIPQIGYDILQASIPEAMAISGSGDRFIENIEFDMQPAAICFGPGAGQHQKTRTAFESLLKKVKSPLLIDADGLNLLAKYKDLLEILPKGSILTPHPKELERLLGPWSNDFNKLDKAKAFSKKHGVCLVLKDAYTMVVLGDELYINSTGNPGMATAGSGDVLSGVITGLLAQQYTTRSAALLGVYIHGKAGDIAAQRYSEEAMLAGDIVGCLGAAFLDLNQGVD